MIIVAHSIQPKQLSSIVQIVVNYISKYSNSHTHTQKSNRTKYTNTSWQCYLPSFQPSQFRFLAHHRARCLNFPHILHCNLNGFCVRSGMFAMPEKLIQNILNDIRNAHVFFYCKKKTVAARTGRSGKCDRALLFWIPADNMHTHNIYKWFRNYGQYFVSVNVCPEERCQDKMK